MIRREYINKASRFVFAVIVLCLLVYEGSLWVYQALISYIEEGKEMNSIVALADYIGIEANIRICRDRGIIIDTTGNPREMPSRINNSNCGILKTSDYSNFRKCNDLETVLCLVYDDGEDGGYSDQSLKNIIYSIGEDCTPEIKDPLSEGDVIMALIRAIKKKCLSEKDIKVNIIHLKGDKQ